MDRTARVWFVTVVAALCLVAAVQTYDALIWIDSPWLGVTLDDDGLLNYRHLEEAPAALRPLLAESDLEALAVRIGGEWKPLPRYPSPWAHFQPRVS